MKEKLRVAEAAAILEVHPETLRRLDNRGVIKAQRDFLGHRIFFLTDILELKHKREQLTDDVRMAQN